MKFPTLIGVYFWFILLSCLLGCANAIFDVFLGSFFGYVFQELFENYLGPGSKHLIGGPTSLVSHVLYKATPFVHPSILGERFDQFLFTTAGWLIGFLINIIATVVEQSVTWSIEGVLLAIQGLLLPFRRRDDDPIAGFISLLLQSVKSKHQSLKEEISRKGRSLSAFDEPKQVENLLDENPALKRFFLSVEKDYDDCLKELLCSINAAPDKGLTKEERKFKSSFRNLTKDDNGLPMLLRPFVSAANLGTSLKLQEKCQSTYQNCVSPFLFRTLFIYLQRSNQKS